MTTTYDEIVRFYKDKTNLVNHKQNPNVRSEESCLKVAKAFYYENNTKNTDNYQFAREMKRRVQEGKLTELSTFKYFTEEEACNLVNTGYELRETNGKKEMYISQKWHLYVSYIAYQELNAKLNFSNLKKVSSEDFSTEKFYLSNQVKQPEYAEWMISEALGEENLPWNKSENKIEEVKKMIKDNDLWSKVELEIEKIK